MVRLMVRVTFEPLIQLHNTIGIGKRKNITGVVTKPSNIPCAFHILNIPDMFTFTLIGQNLVLVITDYWVDNGPP